jgi:transketolase
VTLQHKINYCHAASSVARALNLRHESMTAEINLDELCINTIRTLSMDAVQKAKSGHPGMPMGIAGVAYVLWTRFLSHNPRNPQWPNRDRFILSAGHGSMLLYSLLHLTGYDLSLEDLKSFRQWKSKTPGHPEHGATPGVETTTGPLGQGFGTGVGMAIAERHLAARLNTPEFPVVEHYVYAIVSDGDLMEGVSSETASLAGHLRLGKLIYLYDNNHITIEGDTSLTFTEDTGKRFEAYGWHVQDISGSDLNAVDQAIRQAQQVTDRPSLISVRTHIGYGSPNKQDSAASHGSPLGEDEVRLTKKNLGWPEDRHFHIPPEALAAFRSSIARGEALERDWKEVVKRYAAACPERFQEWQILMSGGLKEGWETGIPDLSAELKPTATREASGKILAALFPHAPGLMGGSADLAPSTETFIKPYGAFQANNYAGRNMHFGVREHAMGAILNGMALHGGLIPYGATFLVFADYMRPSIRLAALMKTHVIYVWTHDSVGLGEDGPTHQPIEHAAVLRAIPGLTFIRPCDAAETAEAWRAALSHRAGPVALSLTRQKVPPIDRTRYGAAAGLKRGAYILAEADGGIPEVVIIATGSEVHVALGAKEILETRGMPTRVVSMPCWEYFAAQPNDYKDSVIPRSVRLRVSVETATPFGWERWVGDRGLIIGIDSFGASAPSEVLLKQFGFTPESVAGKILERLASSS